jgi:hypothetical protein
MKSLGNMVVSIKKKITIPNILFPWLYTFIPPLPVSQKKEENSTENPLLCRKEENSTENSFLYISLINNNSEKTILLGGHGVGKSTIF